MKRNGTLLQIEFTTLSSYLFLLRMSAETLSAFGNRIMFYLAGAVSDFYIPREHMVSGVLEDFVMFYVLLPKLIFGIHTRY